MAPPEAASLTAYLCGLPTTDLHWTLNQVNQMLFLRRMRRRAASTGTDGARPPEHRESIPTAVELPPSPAST